MTVKPTTIYYTEFPQYLGSPLELYTDLYMAETKRGNVGAITARNSKHIEIYFCGPFTSAGAIRIPNNTRNGARNQNMIVAETFQNLLAPQLFKKHQGSDIYLTIPSHIGKHTFPNKTNWGEGDYNLFWLYYLSGIDPLSAREFYNKKTTVNAVKKINNIKFSREEHKPTYLDMMDNFTTYVCNQKKGNCLNRILKMIVLPDHQYSLGSRMEVYLAKAIGITIEEVRVNPQWIRRQYHLWFNHHKRFSKLDGFSFVIPVDDKTESVSIHPIK